MTNKINLDYVAYLTEKWRTHLLKKDPYNMNQRKRYGEVLEMIDEMKNETGIGISMYNQLVRLYLQSEGEIKAYRRYLKKYL